MYSINGVPLDNHGLGWTLRAPSKPLAAIVKQLETVRGRRHGMLALPADFDAISLTLMVNTPRAGLEPLYALMSADVLLLTKTGDPSRQAAVELASASPESFGDNEAMIDATFVLRVPGVFWRSPETTETSTLAGAAQTVRCLRAGGGISAPVSDAVIRVKGAATAIQVTDSGGSWFTFDSIATNEYLRFHADSGRAFLTGTDLWTGGVEVSGRVDFGGPRHRFEITPTFIDAADPTKREGRLTVASATRSGAAISIRARASQLV